MRATWAHRMEQEEVRVSVHNTGAAGDGSQLGLGDSVYQRLLKGAHHLAGRRGPR